MPIAEPELEFDDAGGLRLPANDDGFTRAHRMMEFCRTDDDLLADSDRFFNEPDRLVEQEDARNDRARGKMTWRCRMIAREPNFLRLPHVSENAALPNELQYCLAG